MLLRKKKNNSKLKFNLSCVYTMGAGNGSAQNRILSITRLHIISVEVSWKQRWQFCVCPAWSFLNKSKIEEKSSILILQTTDTYSNLLDFVTQDLRKWSNKSSITTNQLNGYNSRGSRGIKLLKETQFFCQIQDFCSQDSQPYFCSVPVF